MEQAWQQARRQYGFWVSGYVIMPEHVRLLISEPERAALSVALQALKAVGVAAFARPPRAFLAG